MVSRIPDVEEGEWELQFGFDYDEEFRAVERANRVNDDEEY